MKFVREEMEYLEFHVFGKEPQIIPLRHKYLCPNCSTELNDDFCIDGTAMCRNCGYWSKKSIENIPQNLLLPHEVCQ
jgi:hypothetical protein